MYVFLYVDEAKAEMDSLMNLNRPNWETEIEQAFERLKKVKNRECLDF